MAGALLRYLVSDPILALQVVSWLAFAAAAFLLERILGLLAHGSRADSRLTFVGIGFVMAPAFLRSGLTVMSDALGLALALLFAYLRQFAGGAGLGGFLLALLLGCGIAAGLAWGRIARLYAMAALAGDMHARR